MSEEMPKFEIGKHYKSFLVCGMIFEVTKRTARTVTIKHENGRISRHHIFGGYFEPEYAYAIGNNHSSNPVMIAADDIVEKN